MTSPFELSSEMRELIELMDLRAAALQAFPDSELNLVSIGAPDEPRDNPLQTFMDQCFGYGRPQVPLSVALEELTNRGYSNMQVACFLIWKSDANELQVLAERYKTPIENIKVTLQQAITALLSEKEREVLRVGILLGCCKALSVPPVWPNIS